MVSASINEVRPFEVVVEVSFRSIFLVSSVFGVGEVVVGGDELWEDRDGVCKKEVSCGYVLCRVDG